MWLLASILTLSAALLSISFSPLQLYSLSGSRRFTPLINYLLLSADLERSLWKLLKSKTLDFYSFWEYNFDITDEHLMWTQMNHPYLPKFVTPNALLQLRKFEIQSAIDISKTAKERPMLDLRLFRHFCPFGHPDEFAETLFREASFGYGPLFPSGAWCAEFKWKDFYSTDIWPLIDIDCLGKVSGRKRGQLPVIELITDNGNCL